MSRFHLFGAFSKVTPQADGTLVVEGIASSESRDSQGEIVKASAMAAAIPAYMRFGNIREMHDAIAAGKALAISVDDQGVTHLTAHVVDAESCKKVNAGVLQGFSIGGNVPPGGRSSADSTVIETINLTEISLVDRPANPDALITLVKMDVAAKSGEERTPGAPADQTVAVDPVAANPFWAGQRVKIPGGTDAVIIGIQGPNVITAGGTFAASDCSLVDATPQPDDGMKAAADSVTETVAVPADPIANATEAGAVSKKGAKFSGASAAALGDVHKALIACCQKMAGLGYEQKDDGGGDDTANAAQVGDLAKAVTIAKEAESTALKATAAAGEALTKVLAERDAALSELAALKARKPLRSVAIGKGEDTGAPATKAEAAPPEGTEARALYEIKKSLASGGRRLA